MKSSIMLSILLLTSAAQAQLMCSEVMRPSITVAEFETLTGIPTRTFINQFKQTIDIDVAVGEKTPTWQDFESIKILIDRLKSTKKSLDANPETAHLLRSIAPELQAALANDPFFVNLKAKNQNAKENKKANYEPTERELKSTYQFYVRELNKVLPRELRIPVARLQAENRVPKINKEAADYIKGLEKYFEEALKETPIESYEKFVEKIRQSDDPYVKKAIDLIENDQVKVVMRRPLNARFWVPKVGFQNQHVTGSSRGTLSPPMRNNAERNLFGQQEDIATYSARDAEFKPKYGTLSVKPGTDLFPALNGTAHYGPDIYGFKTEAIKDRLTFYPTDSLGPGGAIAPASAKSWDTSLIPWKYRMLMVPHMIEGLKQNRFTVYHDFLSLLPPKSVIGPHYYWESQILGAVRLADVETFTFTDSNPPKGEFLRELIKHNITIYDGRAGLGPEQLQKWTPSAEDLAAP